MKASKSTPKRAKAAAKPVKPAKGAKSGEAAPAVRKPQDISELRTLRLPWGLCAWLSETAKAKQASQTSIVKTGLLDYLDRARLKASPISEERAALMRKVAKLARDKIFPGYTLAKDSDPLSSREAKELLKDPVAKELYEIACEEMSRPTAAELTKAGL